MRAKGEKDQIPIDDTDATGVLEVSHSCTEGDWFAAEPKDHSYYSSDDAACKKELKLTVQRHDSPEGTLTSRTAKYVSVEFKDGSQATYLVSWTGRVRSNGIPSPGTTMQFNSYHGYYPSTTMEWMSSDMEWMSSDMQWTTNTGPSGWAAIDENPYNHGGLGYQYAPHTFPTLGTGESTLIKAVTRVSSTNGLASRVDFSTILKIKTGMKQLGSETDLFNLQRTTDVQVGLIAKDDKQFLLEPLGVITNQTLHAK
jgi:hypothetical protein